MTIIRTPGAAFAALELTDLESWIQELVISKRDDHAGQILSWYTDDEGWDDN